MRWLRLYSEVLHDPKVQRLTPAMFKHWVNLLCLASESEPPAGLLPSTEDIAFALRVKPVAADTILTHFVRAGLVDLTPDGRHFPHGWTRRQRGSDDVAQRVALHRERKAAEIEVPRPVAAAPVTLHETLPKRAVDSDTDTDSEREQRDLVAAAVAPSPEDAATAAAAAGAADDPVPFQKASKGEPRLRPVFADDSGPMELAVTFAGDLRRLKPDIRLPRDLQGWAREFDLMLRVDHRPREKIDAVLAYTVASRFWRRVVLSPAKLREKFDTIDLQREEDADGTRNRAARRAGPGGGAYRGSAASARQGGRAGPRPGSAEYYAEYASAAGN